MVWNKYNIKSIKKECIKMGNIDLNEKGYEKIAIDIIQSFKKWQIEDYYCVTKEEAL